MGTNTTHITLTGNLTRDPEAGFTASGVFFARFSIAVTPRKFDQQSNQWTDGETTFWDTTAWRTLGEHVAESLKKGDRVIATGTVRTHRWQDKETNDVRSRVVLELDDVGPSLTWATATLSKATSNNGPGRTNGAGPSDDPWANSPGGGWEPSKSGDDQPPF
ncbi:single-stranded DNA-binding protein [Yinghuangia sp. ASG 101]|uniref:single-stranded DNA-binding protein n=1 Tax=Yinghuangia sp. ASG 101 TaxID=2896848 RepID=UPI001E462572|nr:single-stranded DNA-binding protein [Yinghuangia sp. ASG 101]UGQ10034.1 single-stranded DNA-binding protein [Yinghuangia sp. ASG 101]